MSQVRGYCNLYLLSFIVTMYLTKFLYEQYSNSRVLIHYIEDHYFIVFFVSIIVVISYSAILIVSCTFKFRSMTLSLSLSLHHVQWILCYRIKNISCMVFIKQLKPRTFVQCKCCNTDWSLAFEDEGCGFESPPWDRKFFFFLSFLHFFPSLLTLRVYPGVYARLWAGSCAFIWRAFLP